MVSLKHSTITGCLFSAAAWILFAASPASAATITFSDPTLFQTTLGPAYPEDFNSLDITANYTQDPLNPTPLSFAGPPGSAYTYSVDAAAVDPAVGNFVYIIDNSSCQYSTGVCWTSDTTGTDKALSTYSASSPLMFTFGSGIDAVGGSFFLTDINGNLRPGTLTLTLSDGTTQQLQTDSGIAGFSGFISSADIGWMTISTDTPDVFALVDNVYVASPEPASMALILSGLAAGVFLAFRKRNA